MDEDTSSDDTWSTDTSNTYDENVILAGYYQTISDFDKVMEELKIYHRNCLPDWQLRVHMKEVVCPAIRRHYRHKQRGWLRKGLAYVFW